jgi:hypothetical protein
MLDFVFSLPLPGLSSGQGIMRLSAKSLSLLRSKSETSS